MKIRKFKHIGVAKNGKVSGGAVKTKGDIVIIDGSCGALGCHCSDGYSISIVMPLKKGVVEGMQVTFENREEMLNKLKIK